MVLSQLFLGGLAIAAGLVFCLRGYLAMRAVIGIWGSFVGFSIGAALVAVATDQPWLSGPTGWLAAFVGALLLGGLAYAFYAVAVVLAMGSVGYGLGAGLAGLFAAPGWLHVVLGLTGGALLVAIAVATNMPEILLILAAASGGASAIVVGLLLVLRLLPLEALSSDTLARLLGEHWWLNVVYLVLFVVGVATQLAKRSTASLRAGYR